MRQMITDLLAIHTENIEGKFNVIRVELSAIKEQTTKTNGRVTRNEEAVSDFVAIRKYWRVFALAGIVTGVLAVMGVYTTYDNFKELYHKDTVTQQKIETGVEVGKENAADISENIKAINKQGVEQSFQKSLNEK